MRVSIRELKTHLSRYIALARQGTVLEITHYRRVVARVSGVPESTSDGIEQMIAQGLAQWHGGKPRGAHIALSANGDPVSRIVLQDRE
jgi:antitoxin (DNA-binding transcriptional repressor) of toxin-antitoxin stability system